MAAAGSIENVIGGAGDDSITGDDNDNILAGGPGTDTLIGGLGSDTVDYSGNTSAGVTVNLTNGTASSSDSSSDTLDGFENVTGSDFGDSITGDEQDNILNGGLGNDTYHFRHRQRPGQRPGFG